MYCQDRKAIRNSICSTPARDQMVSVPQRSRVIASCALHARRRSAHRHKIPRVPTRSGDRQYERSEWTAHYCFAAGWARYLGGVRPGTSVASSSNQGCAELDKEATRRLDGEACNRLAGGGSGPLRILDRGADRKSVASQFYDWPAEVPLISVEVSLRAPACQMHHDFAGVDMLEFALPARAGRLLTNEQHEGRIRHSRAHTPYQIPSLRLQG